MKQEIMLEVNNAITFFTKKFNVDTKECSASENLKDWKKCIEYVGKYGLVYEVFAIAHQNLPENASFQQCSTAIGAQMDEWDL